MQSGIRLQPLEKSQNINKRRGMFILESRVIHKIKIVDETPQWQPEGLFLT